MMPYEQVQQELTNLMDKSADGKLHAEKVVQFARRHKKSALHKQFDWNVKKAAMQHWIEEARRLIRVFVISTPVKDTMITARVYVSLPSDRKDGGGYRTMNSVLNDEAMKAEMLKSAMTDIQVFLRKYNDICELGGLLDEMRRLVKKYYSKQ